MVASQDKLEAIFSYIEKNADRFVEKLRQAVEIPSVSCWPQNRDEVVRMAAWMKKALEKFGANCELHDLGYETREGVKLPLPPVLFGNLGNDPSKKTVCIYGHLDVQPALKEDGWNTDPFKLVENDGKLYGRGSTDDKGPVVAWLNAIEAYQANGAEIPVNIKFCFEGMEESGSIGLDDALAKKQEWLDDVDFTCISDNYWLTKTKPCLTYGLRGLAYFSIEIRCAAQDLHSGVHGGIVNIYLLKVQIFIGYGVQHLLNLGRAVGDGHEAMTDLIYLLGRLMDKNGKILIPHVLDKVAPLTDAELKLYENIGFDVNDYKKGLGIKTLRYEKKEEVLMHRWRYPTLSIHGIEGSFSEPGQKTVIPCRVLGKFSIRLVPNQEPDEIVDLVAKYLQNLHKESGSPNPCVIKCDHSGKPWVSDFNHPHYEAGRKATKRVYGVEPDMTREGGSIPVTLTFQEKTGKNVMLIPLGSCDDMAHSQNEKINRSNYIEGTKLLAAYLSEVAALP